MNRLAVSTILLLITQTSCAVVGGYSNRGGWFLWPGGLGLILMIVLVLFLARRGRNKR